MPMPETVRAQLPGLPEQASAVATARRFFGQQEREQRGQAGLGVVDTDLCLWAEDLTPDQQNVLYIVPAMPTIKMKTAVYPQPGYPAMDSETNWFEELVCTINRWVAAYPLVAGASVVGGALLLGGDRRRRGVRRRRRR